MKRPAILLLWLLFTADALSQAPSGGASKAPLQIAQGGASAPAGSAAIGATVPAANTGGGSATGAVIGLGVAGFAAAAFGNYNSNTAASH
jgi:hypothetical protein